MTRFTPDKDPIKAHLSSDMYKDGDILWSPAPEETMRLVQNLIYYSVFLKQHFFNMSRFVAVGKKSTVYFRRFKKIH